MDGFDWRAYLKRLRCEREDAEEDARLWEHTADSPYVCPRRDCRYYNEPRKGAIYSCDYLGMTGRSRIKQLPQSERLNFQRCPCYERVQRTEKLCTEESYVKNAAYDWREGQRRYVRGESDGEIADALGCARSTVRYWRRRMRLPANTVKSRR